MDRQTKKPIPAEKFEFTQMETKLHDIDQTTKSIGYFKDAWMRFRKNKASVTAAVIIICIVLFAVITPFVCQYEISDINGVYSKVRPKLAMFERSGFWDGGLVQKFSDRYIVYLTAMGMSVEDTDGSGATWEEGVASKFNPIISTGDTYMSGGVQYRDCRIDSYYKIGFQYLAITTSRFDEIRAWEEETGIQVLYPMVDTYSEWCDIGNRDDANFWYRHSSNSAPVDINGRRMNSIEEVKQNGLVDNFLRDEDGNVMFYARKDMNMLSVRVFYYNYYIFLEGHEPLHILGTDPKGYDILARLASGVLLSLLLALSVSAINLTIGALYGAIEGYYGGTIDIVMERISDIIAGLPFIVVATLFQLHLVNKGKVSTFVGVLFAYCITGWLGTAYSVRTQFYRFKNQEYILAARTLGAKDFRLMFKHIFPNAIGTLITSSVMVIPGVILSESILSFLGILNFNSKYMTSLGTMLADGQPHLSTDPHIIIFPALIISLLMISFNLFGNGLRDAFNPSLRGTED